MAITRTPAGEAGFKVMATLEEADGSSRRMFYNSFGLFLFGWFISTIVLVMCTLKPTFIFCGSFTALAINILLFAVGYVHRNDSMEPNQPVIKAGLGTLDAFQAWYRAYVGLANDSTTFFRAACVPYALGRRHVE